MDVCTYCSNRPERRIDQASSSNLYQQCGCRRVSHIDCLVRHIQNTHHRHCEFCFVPFQNVRVIYPNRSCLNWLREDLSTRYMLIRLSTILLLIIYLEYLSLIQLAVQYQYMSKIEIYLLQFFRFAFLFILIFILVFLLIFLISSFVAYRRTGHLNVIPLINQLNRNSNPINNQISQSN